MSLSVQNLSHAFGATEVLAQLNVLFASGEIAAIVGGNGAGKSTLLRLIAGALKPSAGAVCFGSRLSEIRSIREARRSGVWMCDQEGSLIPAWTVEEHFSLLAGIENKQPWRELAADVEPNFEVETLSQLEKQLVEIALVEQGARTAALFDEPTAGLDQETKELVHKSIRRVAKRGAAVLWATHDLRAAKNVADRIIVLRGGTIAADHPSESVAYDEMVEQILGDTRPCAKSHALDRQDTGDDVLRLNLNTASTLSLFKGEVTGLAFGKACSKRNLLRELVGLSYSEKMPSLAATRSGLDIKYMSRERDSEWDFSGQDLRFGLTASAWSSLSKHGWMDPSAERELANDLVQEFSIIASSTDVPIETLSGGNRQKALLARLCSTGPDALLLDEPFSGVDAPTRELLRMKLKVVSASTAVVIVSQELDELVSVADRIIVFRDDSHWTELRGTAMSIEGIEAAMILDGSPTQIEELG